MRKDHWKDKPTFKGWQNQGKTFLRSGEWVMDSGREYGAVSEREGITAYMYLPACLCFTVLQCGVVWLGSG